MAIADDEDQVTRILERISAGEEPAKEELVNIVYAQLRHIAAVHMSKERPNHTLQPTALVNEAYGRLLGRTKLKFTGREQFFATASRVMRRLLVDHARKRRAEKRGEDLKVTLNEDVDSGAGVDRDVLLVDEVLEELTQLDPRAAEVVEMKFFGGMTEAEIARALHVHAATVRRDWAFARAWLFKNLALQSPSNGVRSAG